MITSGNRIIELEEERKQEVPCNKDWGDILSALRAEGGFEIEWGGPGGSCHKVRPAGTVGLFPISEGLAVRVRPKVPIHNLFRMLEIAYRLEIFRFGETVIDADTVEGIYERIAALLSIHVFDRARRGLLRGYMAYRDSFSIVRGRLDIVRTAVGLARGQARFECDFEEHTPDLEDNQLLLWALHRCALGPLRPEVKTKVMQAHRVLVHSVSLVEHAATECVGRTYHRLNEDYRPMHALCRMILEQTGPSHHLGPDRSVSFKLNMPILFERFVAEYLRKHLAPSWHVKSKMQLNLDPVNKLEMEADVVISRASDGLPLLVLDTKHKKIVTTEDVQQVAFYAHQIRATRAILIYPTHPPPSVNVQNGLVRVGSLGLDLAADPLYAAAAFTSRLSEILVAA